MPNKPSRALRVGLLGMYAGANLGDTAIQVAVMQALRKRLGEVEFLGLAPDPWDVARTHGIPAVSSDGDGPLVRPGQEKTAGLVTVARRLRRLVRLLGVNRTVADLDLLIVSGSGQIDDFWGGPWKQPFRLLSWIACARRRGVPVAVLGIGVDELHTRLGARFSVWAMRMAQFRAFRDPGTLASLRAMRMREPSRICPDPAFSLRSAAIAPRPAGGYAVLSPIARNAWPGKEGGDYETYLAGMAAAASLVLAKGLEARFACSQTKMDPSAVDRILAKMAPGEAARCIRVPVVQVDDYLCAVAGARLVVAARLHAAILAMVAGVPVVAVAYSRKVRQLMADTGMPEYCLPLAEASAETLCAMVEKALAEGDALRTRVAGSAAAAREGLEGTYDALAEAVAPKLRARLGRPGRPRRIKPVNPRG